MLRMKLYVLYSTVLYFYALVNDRLVLGASDALNDLRL